MGGWNASSSIIWELITKAARHKNTKEGFFVSLCLGVFCGWLRRRGAKREFRPRPGKGEDLIVADYSNDVMCYIPSLRVLKEGGYEAVDSLVCGGMPGPFDERVEETIFAAMRKAMAALGR